MKKEYRIKKNEEIDLIFKQKRSVGNANLVIYYQVNSQKNFRFAISIGKKYGKAVQRNQAKRQIRSIIQQNKLLISQDINFVIVVKPPLRALDFQLKQQNLINLLIKAHIMKIEDKK